MHGEIGGVQINIDLNIGFRHFVALIKVDRSTGQDAAQHVPARRNHGIKRIARFGGTTSNGRPPSFGANFETSRPELRPLLQPSSRLMGASPIDSCFLLRRLTARSDKRGNRFGNSREMKIEHGRARTRLGTEQEQKQQILHDDHPE